MAFPAGDGSPPRAPPPSPFAGTSNAELMGRLRAARSSARAALEGSGEAVGRRTLFEGLGRIEVLEAEERAMLLGTEVAAQHFILASIQEQQLRFQARTAAQQRHEQQQQLLLQRQTLTRPQQPRRSVSPVLHAPHHPIATLHPLPQPVYGATNSVLTPCALQRVQEHFGIHVTGSAAAPQARPLQTQQQQQQQHALQQQMHFAEAYPQQRSRSARWDQHM